MIVWPGAEASKVSILVMALCLVNKIRKMGSEGDGSAPGYPAAYVLLGEGRPQFHRLGTSGIAVLSESGGSTFKHKSQYAWRLMGTGRYMVAGQQLTRVHARGSMSLIILDLIDGRRWITIA